MADQNPACLDTSTGEVRGFQSGQTVPVTKGGTGLATVTTGDLLYASASDVLSRLAAGSNGNVLTLAGGVPTWAAASGGGLFSTGFIVRVTADQSLSGSGFQRVVWDDAPLNPSSGYWSAGTPTKVEIVSGGTWIIGVACQNANSGGTHYVQPEKNHASPGFGTSVWSHGWNGWPSEAPGFYWEVVSLTSGDDLYLTMYRFSTIYAGSTMFGFKL